MVTAAGDPARFKDDFKAPGCPLYRHTIWVKCVFLYVLLCVLSLQAVDEQLEPLKLTLEGYCEQICQFAAEEEEDPNVPNDI